MNNNIWSFWILIFNSISVFNKLSLGDHAKTLKTILPAPNLMSSDTYNGFSMCMKVPEKNQSTLNNLLQILFDSTFYNLILLFDYSQ